MFMNKHSISWGSAPEQCSSDFGGFKHKIANISLTIGIQLKNSSDLESGRRPKLKSVEFSSCTPMVNPFPLLNWVAITGFRVSVLWLYIAPQDRPKVSQPGRRGGEAVPWPTGCHLFVVGRRGSCRGGFEGPFCTVYSRNVIPSPQTRGGGGRRLLHRVRT